MEGSVIVSINAILYLLLLVITYKRNRQIGPIEILLSLYSTVALFAVFLFYQDQYRWNLSLLNFIYLYAAVVIFVLGVSDDKLIVLRGNPITNFSFYKKLSVLYVFLALFSCAFYLPQVILALQNPEWAKLYEESHDIASGSLITKIANAFFHLRYLGVVLFFSMLSHERCSTMLKILLGVGAFLPVLFVTMLNASRGGLIILVASLVMAYYIFKPILSKGVKKSIRRVTFLIIPLLALYFISVSVSRFENDLATGYSSTDEAYWDYIGQSMLYFNNGVMDCIKSFGHGSYMFALHDNSIKGTNFGSGFITFVGCLYLDFGAIGTLLIGLFSMLILKRIFKKRLGIPELFLLLNYLMFLFYGVFVSESGYGFQWIEIIMIYFGLKFFDRKNGNNSFLFTPISPNRA